MNQDYVEKILALIRSHSSLEEKRSALSQYHENDIAKVFPFLTKEERQQLYLLFNQDILSDIFSYVEEPAEYFEELSTDAAADILENMDTDDAIDILEELEEQDRNELIELMDQEAVDDIKLITSYDENVIGSKMTTNYVAISKDATVRQAMKKMIEEAAINDNISTLYFVDMDNHFFGAMDLRDLILARENQNLKELIKTSYPYLNATEEVSACLEKIQEYALDSIPVLDEKKHLVGVITSDDVVEVVQDELSDDYAKLAGLSSEEDLDESIFTSIKKRVPWLLILLGLGLVTSLLISSFEKVVAALPLIVFFQSLILDMAGNTGTQSLAVTIRVLSSERTTSKDIAKLIFKEIRVGFINGLCIGLMSFLSVFLFIYFVQNETLLDNFKIALSVGVSMLGSMLIASLAGSAIPVIFKKCKIDPAVASGPLITTINDVIAVVIYYGLAWIMFASLIG
ncbi:MAG: magnesium transporter [Anaeroplasma bactoclasticum]|nr:magnesium transporter [Anaeroplasma bactoclasticum]